MRKLLRELMTDSSTVERFRGLINEDSDVEVTVAKKWRVWLQAKFDRQSRKLNVVVNSAELISGRLTPNSHWSLFFVMYLLPEETVKAKSAIHPYCAALTSDDTMNFTIAPEVKPPINVKLALYSIDERKNRTSHGFTIISLSEADVISGEQKLMCLDLHSHYKQASRIDFSRVYE
ncbi:unnamed protein product [Soboliphyme baturini]|uniref:MATH domain-containing protein n=1 Tax=Soboliphyme baturini TaxID=241478 RepID=A0A183J3W3_9BILA|nr:unnamed protein product [Soboliphyme baturini]